MNRSESPLIIGHRGARGHLAENTLASIEKAMELGVDGIEIDVFRCFSGEIVVIHDETLDRTTNGKGKVERFTLSQLKALKVEGKFQIPTLQEVLDLLDAKFVLNIELKGKGTAIEVNHIVQEYIETKGWKLQQFIISSFEWNELRDFYAINKDIQLGILTEEDPIDAIDIAKELKAFSIHTNHEKLDRKKVARIKREGFHVYPWTVNSIKNIGKMIDMEVDAIITDFPERIP